MDIFWGHAFSELFFFGSSIILSNFFGFCTFLGKSLYFYKDKSGLHLCFTRP